MLGLDWTQTAGLVALGTDHWTPSDWGTVVIALSAVATLIASSVFYRWTWRQRNPRPVIVDTAVDLLPSTVDDSVTLELVFSNPGDVPLYPSRLITRVLGWDAREAVTSTDFTSRNRMVIEPRGTASIKTQLNPKGTGKEAFPAEIRRRIAVALLYVSGTRLRRSRYGRVEAITVSADRRTWSHQPVRLRQAHRRERLARWLHRSVRVAVWPSFLARRCRVLVGIRRRKP